MKKNILTLFLFMGYVTVQAQTDTIAFYIDDGENKIEPKLASYYRVGIKQENVWVVYDLYLNGDKMRMKGYYKDDSLKIHEGPFEYFYKSGKRLSNRTYVNGKLHGLSKSWHENGQIKDSAVYKFGVILGEEKGWYDDGAIQLIATYDTLGNGSGNRQQFYKNGVVRSTGTYNNSKSNGIWFFYREDKSPASEVNFLNDSVVAFKAFDEKGNLLNNNKEFEREAYYKAGDAAWNQYLGGSLGSIYKMQEPWSYSGSCNIQFIVDKDGSITNVEAIETSNEKFSNLVIQFIKQSKRWAPAIQYNLPVKAYRRQRLTFRYE